MYEVKSEKKAAGFAIDGLSPSKRPLIAMQKAVF